MRSADIRALSLIQVRDAIARGELTSKSVTEAAVAQAERFNDEFKLFITMTPESALEQAHEMDRLRSEGKALGPLHGVPITVKDNIDIAGLRTTAGSKVFRDRVPDEDATVIRKLKASGE